ncbi:hypothetical protein Q3G72_025831 [Acer saccharum]|nr:hypothetical protein Q3G72_025831 [Acer saccharum]
MQESNFQVDEIVRVVSVGDWVAHDINHSQRLALQLDFSLYLGAFLLAIRKAFALVFLAWVMPLPLVLLPLMPPLGQPSLELLPSPILEALLVHQANETCPKSFATSERSQCGDQAKVEKVKGTRS